jgi:hypothetical protein
MAVIAGAAVIAGLAVIAGSTRNPCLAAAAEQPGCRVKPGMTSNEPGMTSNGSGMTTNEPGMTSIWRNQE